MNRIRVAAAILGTLSLGYFSAIRSLDQVLESSGGAAAPLVTSSGFSVGKLAERIVAASVAEQQTDLTQIALRQPEAKTVRQLATLALVREPLNADAVRSLALVAQSSGEPERAQKMFALAHQLTRRDLPTNVWLATHYGRVGDEDRMLALLDEALTSSQAGRAALFPLLTQVLQDDKVIEPVARLLESSPIWEEDFWAQASANPASLRNVARLRIARARSGYQGRSSDNRSLSTRLIEARYFAEAKALQHALLAPREPGEAVVHNADFAHAPVFADVDWRTYFSGSVAAEIMPTEGVLRIEVFEGRGGSVARQIVPLPGDVFRLEIAATEWEDKDKGLLYARITCAESGASPDKAVRISVSASRVQEEFAKPIGSCTYHWLEIIARAEPGMERNTMMLDSVNIVPSI